MAPAFKERSGIIRGINKGHVSPSNSPLPPIAAERFNYWTSEEAAHGKNSIAEAMDCEILQEEEKSRDDQVFLHVGYEDVC